VAPFGQGGGVTTFVLALVVAAGLLALWIDVRHPKLAPESLGKRVLAAAAALFALELVPVLHGSVAQLYTSVFGILLPALVTSFLSAVWLMRALRDAQIG
jgi:hypothetical protein